MTFTRRALQVLAFICTLLIGAAAMAIVVAQTTWFKEWTRTFIVRQAARYVNGDLSIGRLDGNLLFGVELENIGVTMDGKTVVDIKDVGLDYNVFTLLSGDVVLDDIRLNQPVFHLERENGEWNLAHLIRASTPDQPRRRRPIEIGEIGISDATLYVEERDRPIGTSGVAVPTRIGRLDASIGIKSDEEAMTIDIAHLSLRAEAPNLGINALSGVIIRTADAVTFENVSLRTEESSLRVNGVVRTSDGGIPTIDVDASSDKLTTEEIGRVIPALRGFGLQPAFEITARGPLDRLSVHVNTREAALGNVTAELDVDADGPDRRVAGTVSMANFNFAPLTQRRDRRANTFASNVTGEARIDLALPKERAPLRGTYVLKAGRVHVAGYDARNVVARGRIDGRTIQVDGTANAYGGRASAKGTFVAAQPVSLDLTGRAESVDLRNLPPSLRIPEAPSDLQFNYTLHARNGVYTADAQFDASMVAGASIAPGTTGQLTIGGGAPSYAARGDVTNLDLQQIGQGFAVRLLTEERFRSRVNGMFDVKGSGGGRYPLAIDATGTAVDSELFGATFPRLEFSTQLGGGDLRAHATGEFSSLNPAAVLDQERVAGDLSGTLDVDTTIRAIASGMTFDSVDASGRVDLMNSTIAELAVDRASVEGTYAKREAQLTRFEIAGPDLTAKGQGALALNDTGASNLTAHVESPSLEKIGTIIDRPLKGAVIIDATVTGNAGELRAQGMVQGSNIAYGDTTALSLASTLDVTVPDLAVGGASIKAKSTATFVEVGGQSIRELTADTTYSKSQLEFDAVAQEGPRELAAAGTLTLHPDHQEVHLGNVALRTEQIEWRTVPGTAAAVRYGGDRVEIENLQLASGDQRIEADGVVGSSTEVLQVRAQNVDVSQLDQLMLGNRQISGQLNANASISGPLDAPRAEGEFTLAPGAFRQFTFDSLAGKVDYVRQGVNLDVRLQQSPQEWVSATGYAPLSLFRPNPAGVKGHETPGAGEGIELQVSSSQIDLGVIQGFTSYVTDVTGALQANVKVTGTGHDPHFDGIVDIRGGAFSVPDLGTAYTGLDTRVELTTDAVAISEMKLVDEHKQVMTIGGMLGVHERTVGAVDLKIQSENFEVIDNELADLKLDTDIRVTGELRAPRIEGFVEVETGSVDAARVLEQATANPYDTEVADLNTGQPEPERVDSTPPEPSIFDRIDLEVGVAVPGSLSIRGTDLRPANAPIDIGDLNVTVGGALQVRKLRGARPQLIGEVNTIRGNYSFQGRRFEIMRDGRIRFGGTDELDPVVDLRARRVISGVETFVRVTGSMRQPELTFTSQPPLDQADILSLIVFNVPINELGEGQQISLAERAGALAGGYLVSGLTESLASALELDELEFQTQGEQGFGPSLSIGEQVGEKLFFRIRQGFGAAEATEFILEYQVAEYLRVQGAAAETSSGTQRVTFRRVERGGLDLIFFFSY